MYVKWYIYIYELMCVSVCEMVQCVCEMMHVSVYEMMQVSVN